MFKCPNCGKEISKVIVVSPGSQRCDVDSSGTIINFGTFEPIEGENPLNIECPECGDDIKDSITT